MNKISLISLISLWAIFLGATLMLGQKLSPELVSRVDQTPVHVIIQYKVAPTARHHQSIAALGGTLHHEFGAIRAAHYSLPPGALSQIANNEDVAYITPDRPVYGTLATSARMTNAGYTAQIGMQIGIKPGGIGVAIIDSGLAPVPEILPAILDHQDFTGTNDAYQDPFGHGTHIAGIIASTALAQRYDISTPNLKGLTQGVSLVSLRVLDANGAGTDSAVIAAILYAITNKARFNIRVINLSLGRPVFESYAFDPLCQAVEQAWKAGIVVVVAAGNLGRGNAHQNNGYMTITAPGNDPYVITVGAMKTFGLPDRTKSRVASYSSKGPTLDSGIVKPDILAPGSRVISTSPGGGSTLTSTYPQIVVPTKTTEYYIQLSGTSMATPVVSAAAALLIGQNPKITPDQVKARLMKTAYKTFPRSSTTTDPATRLTYTDQYDIFTVGAGLLDIQAALTSTDLASGSAVSPAVGYKAIQQLIMGDTR